MTVGGKNLIDHKAAVEVMKTHRRTWQLIGLYRSRATASSVAVQIEKNRYSPAYKTGRFETTYLPEIEGEWEVWARYMGEK